MAESKKSVTKANELKSKSKNKKVEDEDNAGSSASSVTLPEDAEDGTENQIGKGVATAAINIDRDEYLISHRELSFDRTQLQVKNNILHRRLSEYYKKRKLDHCLKPLENSQDLEEKYQQKLIAYEEMKIKEEREIADIRTKVEAVEMQFEEQSGNAQTKFTELQNHERNTGSGLIYSKKGKPIADKTVQRFLTLQRHKCEQASALCLRYIRARNAVAELEAIVRKLERIGPGLYVAHYEQLCIDHQNYLNKIEEREDELIKNRNKCTEHNQILAHIREKMHHTDQVIDFTECDLGDAEMEFLRAREDLGQAKGRRDKLRWSLQAERRKAGLLTRKDLLRDFQDATDKVVMLRDRKERLEMQIAKTTQELRDSRRCIKLQNSPRVSDF